jgi:hypothetical protein
MHCALAIFSIGEIEAMLQSEGIEPGTEQFSTELSARFYPAGTGDGAWIEREDWSPGTKSTTPASDREIHIDVV